VSTPVNTYGIPEEPLDSTRFTAGDGSGTSFSKVEATSSPWFGMYRSSNGGYYTWSDMLTQFGPVTAIAETPYERALRYFRDNPITLSNTTAREHAATIVRQVIAESS